MALLGTLPVQLSLPAAMAAYPGDWLGIPTKTEQLPLTAIAKVRNLSPARAAALVPVELTGVVTGIPGYKNSFFFEDNTAGISVDRTDDAIVHVGDRVLVTGTSGPGLFAPVVLASKVRVLGRGRPPPAPRMTLGDLFGGLEDSQWIELRGVVRSAQTHELFSRPTLLLALEVDGGTVNLLIQNFGRLDGDRLIDSVVRVRGVCASSGNEKRQFVGSSLLVPSPADLTVVEQAPRDPFAAPARPVSDILKLGQWQHRVKVAGVVTYQIPGRAMYLQQGDDGIRVQSPSLPVVAVGTRVEALGFPGMQEYAPVLEDGMFRVLGAGAPIAPKRIEAGAVITWRDNAGRADYDLQLVQLQASLIEQHVEGDQHVWIMRQDGVEFEARMPVSAASSPLPLIPDGSLLLLTGICIVHVGNTLNPVSFSVLLRSERDIAVLKRGPWWTSQRALSMLAVFAGIILLALLWVAALRDRVERQTRTIRESEERFRYLSEHDALTGLLNRRAILLALNRQFDLCRRESKTLTVVLGDIDYFKQVNDTHGHLAGDAALLRFTEALGTCMRPYDNAGRYGGEEFLLILSGVPPGDIEERLNTLHTCMSNLVVHYAPVEFKITCSFGAVMIEDCHRGIDPHFALAAADRALYRAKQSGRNRVVVQRERFGTRTPNRSGSDL